VEDVVRVAKATDYGCAIHGDRSVSCWGRHLLRPGSGFPPEKVPELQNVVDLSLTSGSSCALTAEGEVFCWGENETAQLGLGILDRYVYTPTKVEFE
jgi:alpha-tubulin suppressor-like RCC1 family protein